MCVCVCVCVRERESDGGILASPWLTLVHPFSLAPPWMSLLLNMCAAVSWQVFECVLCVHVCVHLDKDPFSYFNYFFLRGGKKAARNKEYIEMIFLLKEIKELQSHG